MILKLHHNYVLNIPNFIVRADNELIDLVCV